MKGFNLCVQGGDGGVGVGDHWTGGWGCQVLHTADFQPLGLGSIQIHLCLITEMCCWGWQFVRERLVFSPLPVTGNS